MGWVGGSVRIQGGGAVKGETGCRRANRPKNRTRPGAGLRRDFSAPRKVAAAAPNRKLRPNRQTQSTRRPFPTVACSFGNCFVLLAPKIDNEYADHVRFLASFPRLPSTAEVDSPSPRN